MQLVPINCMLSCLIINPTTPFKSVNTPTLIVHFDELAISGIGFQALSTRWVKGTTLTAIDKIMCLFCNLSSLFHLAENNVDSG